MTQRFHEYYRSSDGSVAVKCQPGDPWTLHDGDHNSKAKQFVKDQNRFWKTWMKKSIERMLQVKPDI